MAASIVLLLLAGTSLFVGVSNVTLGSLAQGDGHAFQVLMASRLPRTLALILAGMGMAVAGLILQMLVRNKFVEPSTVGTMDSASLGILVMMLFAPDAPVIVKMVIAAVFALAGTALFMRILSVIPLRSVLMVPVIGIMLSGVIGAVKTFVAFRFDLLQSIGAWTTGDFSVVLRGRYELLWIIAGLTVVAYVAADRFTVAGLGQDFTTNLGLNHRRIISLGLAVIALVTAAVVVTVGTIPFLGLIVPNVVSLMIGDNIRRALPWVAVMGAGLVLLCDIIGRLIIYPFEIPIGTVMGVIGAIFFLFLILRRNARVA